MTAILKISNLSSTYMHDKGYVYVFLNNLFCFVTFISMN